MSWSFGGIFNFWILEVGSLIFETDNNAMGIQMNKALKSVMTQQVSELDIECDDRFAEIKRNVSTNLQGRDPEKKAAANELKIFLNPYWDTNLKPLNTQTSLTAEFLGKINASATLKTHAATIGISAMLTGLDTANTALSTLYQSRNEQSATLEGTSASSLKSAIVKSYEQFCNALEQAVNFTPSDILSQLFNQIDELRKTYARLIHKKDKEEEDSPVVAQ